MSFLFGNIVEVVLALVAIVGVGWGMLGRRKAEKRGERKAEDRIARQITEADEQTYKEIQDALESHVADRDAAVKRLRARLRKD